MAQGWKALTDSAQTGPGQEDPRQPGGDQEALPPEAGIPETGAGIPTSTLGVEIWIHGLPPQAERRIVWIDGDEAWIYAGEGTRFNRAAGRLEAFAPPGSVRVEIPRNLGQVVVRLNGNILLRKSGPDVEIMGPVQQRSPSEIVFEAEASTNDGRS